MEHTPEQSVTCIKCNECCKWMTFTLDIKRSTEDVPEVGKFIEYYQRRGCRVKWHKIDDVSGQIIVMIPYMCAELKITAVGGMCRIYDKRPQLCREYDGRWDPHMRDLCKLPVDEVTEVSTPEGPNPFYQCPFCGRLDPGELTCNFCGKLMRPPEDFDG